MATDAVLVSRVRDLAPLGLKEKNVFGARCWVTEGNMAFGVHDDELLVRLGQTPPEATVTPFDPMGGGKPMKGWFLVPQDLLAEDDELTAWIMRAYQFAAQLPPK